MSPLCECGCGEAPKHAARNGRPVRFALGHCGRVVPRRGNPDNYEKMAGGCWEWRGRVTSMGYGELTIRRRHVYAHIYQYEKHVGPVPQDLELDHLCRNPRCCNPAHLEPVTHAINMRRGVRAKLKAGEAAQLRKIRRYCGPRRKVASLYRVSYSAVREVETGSTWRGAV